MLLFGKKVSKQFADGLRKRGADASNHLTKQVLKSPSHFRRKFSFRELDCGSAFIASVFDEIKLMRSGQSVRFRGTDNSCGIRKRKLERSFGDLQHGDFNSIIADDFIG